jgi:hypothetical protein
MIQFKTLDRPGQCQGCGAHTQEDLDPDLLTKKLCLLGLGGINNVPGRLIILCGSCCTQFRAHLWKWIKSEGQDMMSVGLHKK